MFSSLSHDPSLRSRLQVRSFRLPRVAARLAREAGDGGYREEMADQVGHDERRRRQPGRGRIAGPQHRR